MQLIAVHQELSALDIPKMYAANPGVDHPTPPAPDRGSKTQPKPAPKPGKKK